MTEKIRRRGISTPQAYEPDILQHLRVADGMAFNFMSALPEENTAQVKARLSAEGDPQLPLVVEDGERRFVGIVSLQQLYQAHDTDNIASLVLPAKTWIYPESSLDTAIQLMDRYGLEYLPVVQRDNKLKIVGILTASQVFAAYRKRRNAGEQYQQAISVKRRRNRLIVNSRKWLGKER
jgi:CBS domain-containing protein